MADDAALLGGESSGGLTIAGHILGKDGIFACALVVEMLARTKRTVSDLLEEVYGITGRLYSVESSMPATPEMRIALPRRLDAAGLPVLGGQTVAQLDREDGFKFHLADGGWGLLRFSGTEPVLRLFAEAPTLAEAEQVITDLTELAKGN
jgi:phosphomannomutase